MFWFDGWKLGASLWANGVALQETLLAAHGVIEHRKPILETALRRPLDADVAELHLMGAEKMEAFGKAGATLAQSWLALQADMIAQASDIALLLASGWPPRAASIERIGRRGSRIALRSSAAAGRALAPVHAAATSNHRRLGRGTKSGKRA